MRSYDNDHEKFDSKVQQFVSKKSEFQKGTKLLATTGCINSNATNYPHDLT